MSRIVVIGVGNLYRKDDGAGIVAVRRARALLPTEVEVLECTGNLTALLDIWHGVLRCFIVDALQAESAPGTVVRFEAHRQPLPAHCRFFSSHAVGLQDVIELGRALHRLPRELIVYGIQGEDFSEGEGLSPAVETGVEDVVRYILQEIAKGEDNA